MSKSKLLIISTFISCMQLAAERRVSYNPGEQRASFNYGLFQPEQSEHVAMNSIGMLVDSKDKWYGTGILISDRVVLTAGHMFKYDNHEPDPIASNWRFIIRHRETRFTPRVEYTYQVQQVHMHPGWLARLHTRGGDGDGDLLGVDIGVAILSEPVTIVDPVPLPSRDFVETVGMLSMHAGYGVRTDAVTGHTRDRTWNSAVLAAGFNTLDRVREHVVVPNVPAEHRGGVLATDFDDGTQQHNTLSSEYGTIGYIGTGDSSPVPVYMESTTCAGDSGGPLFVQRTDGTWVLVGVNSYGTKDPSVYGDISVYTRVHNHLDWIMQYVNQPEQPVEPEPDATWQQLGNLGWVFVTPKGWCYHVTRGWIYMIRQDDHMWCWTSDIGWWWTADDTYPYAWSHTHVSWMYVDTERSDHAQSMMYMYQTEQWWVTLR